jgi:hypothetical protein
MFRVEEIETRVAEHVEALCDAALMAIVVIILLEANST